MQVDLNAVLGILISALLAILIGQVRANRVETKDTGKKLDSHILEMVKAMTSKIDSEGCKSAREECRQINDKLIIQPVTKALVEQRSSYENLWLALRTHTHTGIVDEKDRVIVRPGI
jgi:hypothetical protein